MALADQERLNSKVTRVTRVRQVPRAEIREDAVKEAQQAQEEMIEHQRELQEDMEKHEHEMDVQSEHLKMREQELREMETEMKKFQEELKELLVTDGYIQKQDKIKSINWDDDGEIEVNGKKIKDADRQKYNDLHKKYFKKGHYQYID
jgi:hypothetical protein